MAQKTAHRRLLARLAIVVVGTATVPRGTAAQSAAPPPAPQQASPMAEGVRRHERLVQQGLPGVTVPMTLPGGTKGELYVTTAARGRRSVSVLVHFHGAAWIPRQSAESQGRPVIVVSLSLGSGSGVYDRTFRIPGMTDSLMVRTQATIDSLAGRRVELQRLYLSGFSAGHGAIRAILRDSAVIQRVNGVLLMDAMHTSYVPEGMPLASGSTLDSRNLLTLTAYARRAARGDADARMLVTHSEIFPGTFASTTETAAWMLQSLGMAERPVLKWGPRGMQQLGEAKRGGLLVMGFAGNSAPDHIDHYHAMPELLRRLMR